MGKRRHARELALQGLFYSENSQRGDPESLDLFIEHYVAPEQPPDFFLKVYNGVKEHGARIDRLIEANSTNWKLYRMSAVDRNVMRIAVFEFLFCEDIPEKVSLNEAIDIGKKYGTEESGSFINGILDSIRLHMKKKRESGGAGADDAA
ncbi:MAG: transcription antitermination factor NusB [Desulfatibacillaceae bacterium]